MAEKSKKNNKNLIIGICAGVVAVIVIIVAVVLATAGSSRLGDSYFVSDDSKYVISMNADEMGLDGEEYAPNKVHLVYYYSDDEVTGLESYYEYTDNASAKAAYDTIIAEAGDEASNYRLDGKYIVITADESEYEGMTASDAKQQIEFMEMLKNMDFDDEYDEGDEDETYDVEEDVIEEDEE